MDNHRDTITELYHTHSLAEVRQIMIDRYVFQASLRTYHAYLDRWGEQESTRQIIEESTTDSGSSTNTGSHIKNDVVEDDLPRENPFTAVWPRAEVANEDAGRHADGNVPILIMNSF